MVPAPAGAEAAGPVSSGPPVPGKRLREAPVISVPTITVDGKDAPSAHGETVPLTLGSGAAHGDRFTGKYAHGTLLTSRRRRKQRAHE